MHSVKLQIDHLCKVWKTISKAMEKRRKSCVSSSSRETRLFAGSKKKPKSSSLSRGRRQTRWHLVTLLLRRESAMASRLKLKCLQASQPHQTRFSSKRRIKLRRLFRLNAMYAKASMLQAPNVVLNLAHLVDPMLMAPISLLRLSSKERVLQLLVELQCRRRRQQRT